MAASIANALAWRGCGFDGGRGSGQPTFTRLEVPSTAQPLSQRCAAAQYLTPARGRAVAVELSVVEISNSAVWFKRGWVVRGNKKKPLALFC